VVQEGLTNIHRHSGSASASIRLNADAEQVVLELSDQGRGMPVNLQGATVEQLGLVLRGMENEFASSGAGWKSFPTSTARP